MQEAIEFEGLIPGQDSLWGEEGGSVGVCSGSGASITGDNLPGGLHIRIAPEEEVLGQA